MLTHSGESKQVNVLQKLFWVKYGKIEHSGASNVRLREYPIVPSPSGWHPISPVPGMEPHKERTECRTLSIPFWFPVHLGQRSKWDRPSNTEAERYREHDTPGERKGSELRKLTHSAFLDANLQEMQFPAALPCPCSSGWHWAVSRWNWEQWGKLWVLSCRVWPATKSSIWKTHLLPSTFHIFIGWYNGRCIQLILCSFKNNFLSISCMW